MQRFTLQKKAQFILSFIFFLFLFVFNSSQSQAQTSSYVSIISPNGGETYSVGDTVRISWNSNASVSCTLSYFTSDFGPSMTYYIGSVNSSQGYFDWTVSKPLESLSSSQQKIMLVCWGLPADYSDNYFTVEGVAITPTPTLSPTPTATPTPTPVCNLKAELAFTNTATVSAYRGQSIHNEVTVTNPNDPECGSRVYGLSHGYPGGWTMNIPLSVTVAAGSFVNVPLELISDANAQYKTYSYSVYAGDSSGGVLVGVTNYVSIIPKCDATVQASLLNSSQDAFPGTTLANRLILTNPNPLECTAKNYVYSRSYPGGWNLIIQPNVTVQSGETVSVPFDLSVSDSAVVGSYPYNFWVYNAWVDGSSQASVAGTVQVLDNIPPSLSITNPVNNSYVFKNTQVTILATAADNVGVSRVEFFVDGVLTCTDTSASYTCDFKTDRRKKVKHIILVKAYDAAGNMQIATSSVTTR